MGKRRSIISGVAAGAAAVTASALVAVALPAQAATNLVANGGFESGLSGWTCDAGAAAVSGHAHAGSGSLAGTPSGMSTAQCSQTVAVSPNTDYSLSAYVNGSYVYLGVTGTGGNDASTWTPGTGGNYSQLSVNFHTGASASAVTVYVHGWYGQPTFYVDDVNVPGSGGETPPPTSPTPSPTPTPTPTSTPTPTPTPTPTTTPTPPSGPLPARVLTGYWQNFYNGAKALRLADVPTTYDLIAVAFADSTSTPGAVSFTLDSGLSAQLGGYTTAQFKADIATAHSRGQHVIISVGGEKGSVSVSSSAAANAFANSVYSLMQEYGFDGVDIDLENGLSPTYMAQALRQLSSMAGPDLIITLAPQTIDEQSTGRTYFQLALAIKDILTINNMQYYNSGSMLGCDQQVYSQGTVDFLTALACIQLKGGLRADQVGLGLPASRSAAGGGYQSPSNVNAALDCLAAGVNCGSFHPDEAWPNIRGAMTWSINWDASNGYAFANTVAPHLDQLGNLPTPTPTSTNGGGGTCSAPAWSASAVYNGGAVVSYNGYQWHAKWWTQGDEPGNNTQNVWVNDGRC